MNCLWIAFIALGWFGCAHPVVVVDPPLVSPPRVAPGETVTVTMRVGNRGDADFDGALTVEAVPPGAHPTDVHTVFNTKDPAVRYFEPVRSFAHIAKAGGTFTSSVTFRPTPADPVGDWQACPSYSAPAGDTLWEGAGPCVAFSVGTP